MENNASAGDSSTRTSTYRSPPVRREPARNADDTFHVWEKTDAPVFCGTSYIPQGETVYFCLYKPNRQADYAYYMLPELVQSLKHRP